MQQSLLTDFKPQIRDKIRSMNERQPHQAESRHRPINATFDNIDSPDRNRGGTLDPRGDRGNARQGRSRDRNPRS